MLYQTAKFLANWDGFNQTLSSEKPQLHVQSDHGNHICWSVVVIKGEAQEMVFLHGPFIVFTGQ